MAGDKGSLTTLSGPRGPELSVGGQLTGYILPQSLLAATQADNVARGLGIAAVVQDHGIGKSSACVVSGKDKNQKIDLILLENPPC